jgi:hypothetical protein
MTEETKIEPINNPLQDDVTWVMERCPKLNTLAVLEPTAQAIAIMLSICGDGAIENPLDHMEIAKLSLVGIIAMHARQVDEEKFQTISPYAYLQVANHYLDPDDEGNNFKEMVRKLHKICLDPHKP